MAQVNTGMVFDGTHQTTLIDSGDYEVTLKAEKKQSKDGSTEYLRLEFTVRDDVPAQQDFAGRRVFETLFKDKGNTDWFNLAKTELLVLSQKKAETDTFSFNDVDECILFLNGISLVIGVEKVLDDTVGKEVNQVKFKSYRPSTLPAYVFKEEPKVETAGGPVTSDDLPF